MSATMPTARDAFLRMLPDPRRVDAAAHDALDETLAGWIAQAKRAWPTIALEDATFLSFVAERWRDDIPFAEAAPHVRPGDLYLACACARGDSTAIRVFEEHYFHDLDALWPAFRNSASLDEARQRLRQKLFVASADGTPKISKFSGRGDLRGWTRVVAGRMLADLGAEASPERPVDDAFFEELGTGTDLELDRLKARYGAEFKEAFRQAIDALSARERNLLRLTYVRHAGVAEVGAAYGVHTATAARWIVKARERLVRLLRKSFAERLSISSGEVDSILRLIESTASLTLERYLREEDDEG